MTIIKISFNWNKLVYLETEIFMVINLNFQNFYVIGLSAATKHIHAINKNDLFFFCVILGNKAYFSHQIVK